MTAYPPPDRDHALDALRGACMFLVVLMHAAIPYTKHPLLVWPVRDTHRDQGFDFFLLAGHHMVLQVFFLLAGYFGCRVYGRLGARRTAVHRLRRIGLPLVLALVTIHPILQAVSVYALADADQSEVARVPTFFGQTVPADTTPLAAVAHHFTSDGFFRFLVPAHLWFLWFLLLCFAIMLPLAWVADRLRHRAVGVAWDSVARWVFRSPLRWLVLPALTWPLLLPMTSPVGPDTPFGWTPPLDLLAYYFLFFLVGWALYRHRDFLPRFASGWQPALALGQIVVLPAAIMLLYLALKPWKVGATEGWTFRASAMGLFALYTWLTVSGLIGLFRRYLLEPQMWARRLGESSYWCYLASLPPIVLFQYLLSGWDVPAGVKFTWVSVVTMVILLGTYRWWVRDTWVGRLLNGPRENAPKRDVAATAPTTSSESKCDPSCISTGSALQSQPQARL